MCKCVCKSDLILFAELRGAGIPLDEGLSRELMASSVGLSIYQVTPGRIFGLDCGGTGYVLGIGLRNDSHRIVSPHAFRLEIPWEQERFGWLEPVTRRSTAGKMYSWPGERSCGIPAGEILNHRIGGKGKLFPGDSLEGFLLGVGDAVIPESYHDGQSVQLKLSVFDARGNRYEVKLKVRTALGESVAQPQTFGGRRRAQT